MTRTGASLAIRPLGTASENGPAWYSAGALAPVICMRNSKASSQKSRCLEGRWKKPPGTQNYKEVLSHQPSLMRSPAGALPTLTSLGEGQEAQGHLWVPAGGQAAPSAFYSQSVVLAHWAAQGPVLSRCHAGYKDALTPTSHLVPLTLTTGEAIPWPHPPEGGSGNTAGMAEVSRSSYSHSLLCQDALSSPG